MHDTRILTIGILLPGSTLYPSIGMDFMHGIKSSFKFHKLIDVDYKVSMIGYGLKTDGLYAETEKLLVLDNVDVVIAYVEDYHAAKLSPLFAAAGKLLLIVNTGANYPDLKLPPLSNTLFHSLNDCLCCFLTGKYAAQHQEGYDAILATSFFDGGYRHTHAMYNAFINSGGSIKHNYVSHFKKEEFNTDSITSFIKENPDNRKLLALFSGDTARFFYKNLAKMVGISDLQWYCSPMMFDCTPGDFDEAKPEVPNEIHGYTYWVPELINETNYTFLQYYKIENEKEANLFSMHGWETALLIMEYFIQRKNSINTESAINLLIDKQLKSPRGSIFVNKERYIMAPAYQVSATGRLSITIGETINDPSESWQEMVAQIPDEIFASWRNTYLCI